MDKKEILSKLQPYKALHPKMYELIKEVIESHPEVDKENIFSIVPEKLFF